MYTVERQGKNNIITDLLFANVDWTEELIQNVNFKWTQDTKKTKPGKTTQEKKNKKTN